jgi:hypothetical protein
LGDFTEVFDGEDDPVPVEMERDLLAVGACPERALGDVFQSDVA